VARAVRQHLQRTCLATGALVALFAAIVWSRREAPYVPGEIAQGTTDALARELPSDRPALRFTDASEAAGIDFLHFPATRANVLPEDMGSGIALGDVDQDGWTDIFLVNEAAPLGKPAPPGRAGRCALYRSRGDGTFEDWTDLAGAGLARLGMGAAFLDADSDGDLDLLVTSYGGLDLLRNDGTGHFTDATAEAGLAGLEGFWTGIATADYDRDGWCDAYVCGYVRYVERAGAGAELASQYGLDIPAQINPSAFEPERNLLLHNAGGGRFEELGARAGVENREGRSLGAFFADLTGNGWPDLYVLNDVSDNALFVNLGDGSFEDATSAAMVGDYRGAMGAAVGDFDGDLDLDFFITHWVAQENALYVNLSRPPSGDGAAALLFMDMADRFGLGHVALDRVGWAAGFVDFDQDGRLDLFAINGSTIPLQADRTRLAPMRSQLFWNGGGGRGFFELGAVAGDFWGEAHVGRGGASFDYDLDGDEDLVVVLHGERARLLRNDGGNANRSILVRLRQREGNRFALGARVRVDGGGRIWLAELGTQGSYLSQHAVGEQAFGLGRLEQVERLAVTWPDGATEESGPLPADSLVTWVRGEPPRVEPLPGKREEAQRGRLDVEGRRRFHRLVDRAGRERIAGELESAVASYREALELWPGHEDALYYLGNCLLELGRRDEALPIFERLVAVAPESSRGWMQIGQICLARGERRDLEEAERAFERCHAINAEESLPVVRMGLVALLRGDLDEADELLADACMLNARSVEALWLRGSIAWRRGEREAARSLLEQARAAAQGLAVTARDTAFDEGDTRAGKAMTTSGGLAALARWRTLLERELDPELEYGP
jgi:hypothetical protein